MSQTPTPTANRLDRRKARTRAALIRAAQGLIAQGRTNASILEITQAADVGMGSFYNHFETKEQLYEAAVEAVMDAYGQLLDDKPDRDAEQTTDRMTEDLLRMFGVPRRQAQRICTKPLPDLDGARGDGSAA